MFTGLVQAIGLIKAIEPLAQGGKRFWVEWPQAPKPFVLGESIAIDGCCMTVTRFEQNCFEVEASPETLGLTLMQHYTTGQHVNLERALSMADPLGGHFVSGHVDGLGQVTRLEKQDNAWLLAIQVLQPYQQAITPCLLPKGSVAVSGISLTLNAVKADEFELMIIPHTFEHTTVQYMAIGALVNLEADMIAKAVNRQISAVLEQYQQKMGLPML